MFKSITNLFKRSQSNSTPQSYLVSAQPKITDPSPINYPFVYMHNEGCKSEAFYLKTKPEFNTPVNSEDHVYPNGTVPAKGATILCVACMYPIGGHSANVVRRK